MVVLSDFGAIDIYVCFISINQSINIINIPSWCRKTDGTPIEEVQKFTYLGSIVNPTGGTEDDIKSRNSKARNAFSTLNKIWNYSQIKLKTKLKLFNSNVKSTLLYGSESWALTKTLESELQVFLKQMP